MLNKKSIFIPIILVIFLIGLFIWVGRPVINKNISLTYKKNNKNSVDIFKCSVTDNLLKNKWLIGYPERLENNEKIKFSVSLIDQLDNDDLSNDIQSDCEAIIEVFLNVPARGITPGKRIFEIYQQGKSARFELEVQPIRNENVSGTLWISVIEKYQDRRSNRTPLFAIPIVIAATSIMGVSLQFFRIILFIIISFVLCLYILLNNRG